MLTGSCKDCKEDDVIYTVTFNPAIDYIVTVDGFETGRTNRTASELMLPGGKGINVSIVLGNLGIPSTAIYFSAGFTGDELTRLIQEYGIRSEEIRLTEGYTRINLKLRSIEGTEINGHGPVISSGELQNLMDRIGLLRPGDILVLSGSIPASVPQSIYGDIMKQLEGHGIEVVADAEGALLMNTLSSHPLLIKPNRAELEELFSVICSDLEQIILCAQKLQQKGARHVLVSLGGEGAVLVSEDGAVFRGDAPEGKLINAVGAGDSMVAGFLAGWQEKQDPEYAFRMALCAGSASAYSEYLATGDEIMTLMDSVKTYRI